MPDPLSACPTIFFGLGSVVHPSILYFYSFPLTTSCFFPSRYPRLSDPTEEPGLDPIASLASIQSFPSRLHLSMVYSVHLPLSFCSTHCHLPLLPSCHGARLQGHLRLISPVPCLIWTFLSLVLLLYLA